MGIFGGIIAAILVAILISAAFYYGFNTRGPWGSIWTFFLVLLLIIWAANIWVRPIGPVYGGVAWIPLFFIGLVFALLLAAIPIYDTGRDRKFPEQKISNNRMKNERLRDTTDDEAAAVGAVGWIFWVFIVILMTAIIIGLIT